MKLERHSLTKYLLPLLIALALALSNLDFAHADAGYTLHGDATGRTEISFTEINPAVVRADQLLLEELDNSDNTATKRRLPVAVANTVALKTPTTASSTIVTSRLCPLARPARDHVEIKVLSLLEKEKEQLNDLKAQPLWLRLGVLLI